MKKYLFFALMALVFAGCSSDDDDKKENYDQKFSFLAKSTLWSGMWSIPSYEFTYDEDYSYVVVEATINNSVETLSKSPSSKGTLYYSMQIYDEGVHYITIYNVEKNASIPIEIKFYK